MKLFLIEISLLFSFYCFSQNTVGVIYNNPELSQEGYTLFAPISSTETYLIDNCGQVINQWSSSYTPGMCVYLLEDGSLLRACKSKIEGYAQAGKGGIIERRSWNNELLWSWENCWPDSCLHHDIAPLPNGNILVVKAIKKTKKQSIDAGRDTTALRDGVLWTESIIEIKPIGINDAKIVWQWNAWDHLVQDFDQNKNNFGNVASHPELLDINYNAKTIKNPDILHINSIAYHNKRDQILISLRNTNEIWIIDHSTTMQDAAKHKGGVYGHGGDILYRWGNPIIYKGTGKQLLDGQHDAKWIPEGQRFENMISVFNNGVGKRLSEALIIQPPYNAKTKAFEKQKEEGFMPDTCVWSYTQTNLFSGRLSSIQSLENGNYLICEAAKGVFTEVTFEKDTVWKYVNPVSPIEILSQGCVSSSANTSFRCQKYSKNYKAFDNKIIFPKGTIEYNTILGKCKLESVASTQKIKYDFDSSKQCIKLKNNSNQTIKLLNYWGITVSHKTYLPNSTISLDSLLPSIYHLSNEFGETTKIIFINK